MSKWVKVTQSCLTLCDPMDYTVLGILQASIMEGTASPFSRGSSQPKDQTQVFHIAGRFFTSWATREAPKKDDDLSKRHRNHVCYQGLNLCSPLMAQLEKATAPHSSTLAWKIPWTEEPGRQQSMGSHRVGHDWVTSLSLFTFMHWRRPWQPTPVFLPGESQGWGSLVGCCLWGRTKSDTTQVT